MSSDIGLFGLSPRANNLAVNLALKGVSVTVGNRSSDMVQMIISK
jgi:singapore isolate B (sub-type 7) whole genome shotgun sequence assembly, scaffold_0